MLRRCRCCSNTDTDDDSKITRTPWSIDKSSKQLPQHKLQFFSSRSRACQPQRESATPLGGGKTTTSLSADTHLLSPRDKQTAISWCLARF
ncbi:hypothetical protein HYQ46_003327 [Verticillium longisporum]|nr:hypothetical protein HYQ46_003327 [Verticillium longisporum]